MYKGSATVLSAMSGLTLVNWVSFFCIFACSQPSSYTQPLRMSARMFVRVRPGAGIFIVVTTMSGVIQLVIPGRRAPIQPWRRNCGCYLRAYTCRAYSFSDHSTVNPGCLAAAGSTLWRHTMKHASCSLYAMHSPDTCPKHCSNSRELRNWET